MSQSSTPIEQQREALDRLIAGGEIRCVFQPVVDLVSGAVAGYEALTRVGLEAGFESPGALFDEAARHGRLWDLEMLTRRACLASLPEWPEGVLLFMNCNPEVAADPRFAETFLRLVGECDAVRPERIVLEITERAETQHTAGLSKQIARLRESGMQIAIDDLGAGVSGLQRIMELRPHWLKLDRELTAGVERDAYKQNLLDVLLRFTRVSGVRLVAEGVETLEQLGVLVDLGVQHAQGYLIGRPDEALGAMPRPLEAWLRERREQAEQRERHPNLSFLASIMTEGASCPAELPLDEALLRLEKAPDASGVAATRDGVFVGWAGRERLRRTALQQREGATLGAVAREGALIAPATTLVSEALLLLATQRPEEMQRPILVEESGEIVGEVAHRALLREASRLVADQEGNYTQISGLPGRVQCDRRLTSVVGRAEPASAIFVDIRGFHSYNERFGFELGDLILRILAGIVACSADESGDDFAGHLGDDRFLLVTTGADPDALASSIVREFEGATDRFVACADESEPGRSNAGLRIVILRRPGGACANASEVHRAAWRLRESAPGRALGRSVVIEGPDPAQTPSVRLSA